MLISSIHEHHTYIHTYIYIHIYIHTHTYTQLKILLSGQPLQITTQRYLDEGSPSDRPNTLLPVNFEDILHFSIMFPPLPQPIKAGTQISYPRGMQG